MIQRQEENENRIKENNRDLDTWGHHRTFQRMDNGVLRRRGREREKG